MLGNVVETVRQMDALVRWRSLLDRSSWPPFGCRPDRPRDETAAAVRAHIVELILDTAHTERALIAADARFRRTRRKILVAIFAVRSQLQRHGRIIVSR